MNYGYYPGCSLTGSAHKLDKGIRKVFEKQGHTLKEIPDWNCCGAFEYGDRKELTGFSKKNLEKASGLFSEIVAPCPACYKNLREADEQKEFTITHPLDLFDDAFIGSVKQARDLKGHVFTPYYGCILLRPRETAIQRNTVMEEVISRFGGDVAGEKVKDRCCGGNQIFINKSVTEKLSKLVLEKSKGTIVVFCPLCHMAMKTFSGERKVIYLTDLLLYIMGENKVL
ncbi:MAG: heterodisulfide reductase-related iron-sulfur binding cluster [Deltaproteobacteria bacterium]|nr:heterodisulfide reductase-related iron-sulfur binding cluster [Pseudomonadota bacterium]